MALTKEDLQAISELMDSKLQPINKRLDSVENKLDALQEGTDEIRTTTNALVGWADQVAVISQVRFPVKKDGE